MRIMGVVAVVTLVAGGTLAWAASNAGGARGTLDASLLRTAPAVQSSRYPRPPAAANLRLEGEVALPGASAGPATLTLRVGGEVTVLPITLPAYSILVSGTRPDDMVSIEIETPGSLHAAILGSYRRLQRQAGQDAVLVPQELDRLRVSPLSTSLHYHVSRELGGRLPVSDWEHEQAVRSIGDEVAVGGYVLHALATGDAALPAGYPHGYALLQDQTGLRDYLAGEPELAAGWEAFARQPSGIPFPEGTLATMTAVLPDRPYGEPAMATRNARLLLRRHGGYEYHGRSATDSVATLSAPDAETLRMTPRVPGRIYAYPLVEITPGQPPTQVFAHYDVQHETYRRLFVGDRYSLWSVTEAYRITYPENPQLPADDLLVTRVEHAFTIQDLSHRIRPVDVVGRRVLPYFCVAPDAYAMTVLWDCDYAQTTFHQDGTGQVQEVGSKVDYDFQPWTQGFGTYSFEWRIGQRGGPLQLKLPGTDLSFWRIEGGDAVAAPVVYLARKLGDDGRTYTRAGQSVLMDAGGTAGFEQVAPLGSWKYATFEQNRGRETWQTRPYKTVFTRDADAISRQVTTYESPSSTTTLRSRWQLVGIAIDSEPHLRLYDSRFRGNTGFHYASCAEANADGATACIPDQVRYFRPMAQHGERMYGIEDLYTNGASFGQAPLLYRTPRPTYYERTAEGLSLTPAGRPTAVRRQRVALPQ